MSALKPQSEHTVQAVFCVCASEETSAAAATACAALPGAEFVGEFHEYFDGDRRPQFSATVLEAAGAVALVDCDRNPEQALITMDRLRTAGLKNLRIVGLGTAIDASYLLKAMRAGCNEFVPKPAAAAAISEALQHLQSTHQTDAVIKSGSGRVISLFGAKGGVGTTTLAVHLANNLVRRHRKHVLLIDHHHELGHVALLLGIKNGQYHFEELIRNVSRLDADLLKGFVTQHVGGLEVLTAPDTCAADQRGTPDEIKSVLNFLRTQYDFVIIDSSMVYKDSLAPILEVSDEIFVTSTPDVAALRDLARRIEHLSLTQSTTSRLRIVLNRATSEDAVTSEQVETAVRFPVWIAIPNNYSDLVRAINSGEPIAADHRSVFAQQINKWAQKLINVNATRAAEPEVPKRRFAFFRKDEVTPLRKQNA